MCHISRSIVSLRRCVACQISSINRETCCCPSTRQTHAICRTPSTPRTPHPRLLPLSNSWPPLQAKRAFDARLLELGEPFAARVRLMQKARAVVKPREGNAGPITTRWRGGSTQVCIHWVCIHWVCIHWVCIHWAFRLGQRASLGEGRRRASLGCVIGILHAKGALMDHG